MADMSNYIGPPRQDAGFDFHDRLGFNLAAIVVFLVPFNVLRLPGIYFTAADTASLVAIGLLALTGRLNFLPFGRLSIAWLAAFVLLVGGLLIGAIAENRIVAGADVLAQYAFAFLTLPLAITRRARGECLTLILIFMLAMAIAVGHGALVMHFDETPAANIVSASGRLRSVLERENAVAAMAAVSAVFAIYLASEGRIRIALAVPCVLLLIYGILLAASNSGLFALIIGFGTFSLLQWRARPIGIVLTCAAAGAVILSLLGTDILPERFIERVLPAFSDADLDKAGTFSDRVELIEEGWRAARDHSLIGMGPDGFRAHSSHGQPVHNTFILMLVEGGAMAFLGLVWLIAMVGLTGVSLTFDRASRGTGALVISVTLIYILVLSSFAHIYARFWFVPLILILALALSQDRRALAGRTTAPTRTR